MSFGQKKSVILINCRIIDGTGKAPLENGSVVVIDGIITDVGDVKKFPRHIKTIDLHGKTVIPGLIDAHTHFWSNGVPQLESWSNLYLASGVTTAFSCGELNPDTLFTFRETIERGSAAGPRIFTVGPYFQKKYPMGRDSAVNTVEDAIKLFQKYSGRIDGIKVYDNITTDQFVALAGKAREGNLPLVAHLYNELTADFAIEHGLNILSHGVWCIPDVRPDIKDSPFCQMAAINLKSDTVARLIDKIVTNNVAVCPTITALETTAEDFNPILPEWRMYLNAESRNFYKHAYKSTNQECYRKVMTIQKEFIKMLYHRGAFITTGSDAVFPDLMAGFAIHREIKHLTECGISNIDAIKCATLLGAVSIRKEKIIGSIEPGKYGDLLVLAGSPDVNIEDISNVFMVIKGGEIYNPVECRQKAIESINLVRKESK